MADILIAEDDADVRKWLAIAFETEGHAVRAVANGSLALAAVREKRPDLLILDVMVPACDGIAVCGEVRKTDMSLPILMLTARASENDKESGLGIGADDYMIKPFSMTELFARVGALLRRGSLVHMIDPSFEVGGSYVDGNRRKVVRGEGRETDLAAREYGLLKLLARHRGEALSRDRLLNELWGVTFYGNTRTLDQHVALVRRKLGPDAEQLETVRNIGYRLK